MTLDDRIRELCKKGVVTYIALVPIDKGKWQAGFRDTSASRYRIEIDSDPVKALHRALDGKPPKEPRKDLIG